MKHLSSIEGDLKSYSDNIDESMPITVADRPRIIHKTYPHKHTINTQTEAGNKGRFVGEFPLGHLLSFCKTFEKILKELGLDLEFKMKNLQSIN